MATENEARRLPSACKQSIDWRAVFQRLRNRPPRNPAGKDRDGPAHRGRSAGRLLYRPALLQTRFQILGIRPAARTTLDHGATGDVERKTKARARPRTARVWERQ